jgi:serine/threonine protein phosphatase PrpC
MASIVYSNPTYKTFSHATKQNTSAQDFSISGECEEFKYLVVADGHGSSDKKYAITDMFSGLDWEMLLNENNFHLDVKDNNNNYTSTLYRSLQDLSNNGDLVGYGSSTLGSTLSIVKIFPDRFECFYIGDSTIKIYEKTDSTYNLVYQSVDHDFNFEEDMDQLMQRSKDNNLLRNHWKKSGISLNNGVETKNIKAIETVNSTTIMQKQSAYIYFDDGSKINMTRSLGHIPNKEKIEYATENNLTLSLSQKSMTKNVIPREQGKTYNVITASDGLWDMISETPEDLFRINCFIEKHIDVVQTPTVLNVSYVLCEFAFERWMQEWDFFDEKKNIVVKISMPLWNADDIAVACGCF